MGAGGVGVERRGVAPTWLVLAVALWFVVRGLLGLGPWFLPATLTAAAAVALARWWRARRPGSAAGVWALGAWAVYAWLDLVLGGLSVAVFLVALALGLVGFYYLSTRPNPWLLVPAGLLLAVATVLWVLSVGMAFAKYLIPLALILWGLRCLFAPARRDLE